tara:strand:+ start:340 stop:627 length:288 start_codon:yes stop_codon:yes gene_type:complete
MKTLNLYNVEEVDKKLFAEKSIFSGEIEVSNIGDQYRDNALYEIEKLEDETTEVLVEVVINVKVQLEDCMGRMVLPTHIIEFHILKEEDINWIRF